MPKGIYDRTVARPRGRPRKNAVTVAGKKTFARAGGFMKQTFGFEVEKAKGHFRFAIATRSTTGPNTLNTVTIDSIEDARQIRDALVAAKLG